MKRREFLTTGAAGLAGVTGSVGLGAQALAALGTPARAFEGRSSGTGWGMLAPAADYPYAVRQGYFNNAALGLSPVPVRAKMRAIEDGIATEGASYFFKALEDLTVTPRVAAARLYGTTPEKVGLTRSISETICQFAWWLRPARGKNVVSIDIEVPATTLPWMRVAQETGAEVRLAQVWSDPASLSLEKVTQLIDANTVAVCITHVQWITGYRMDLKGLADAAHAQNALLIVDAMHSTGVVPIHVERDGVDVLVAGGYKWLGGVTGIAACYVRPELMARFDPILLGADTNQPPPPYDAVESRFIQLPEGPAKFDYCSASHSARVGFGAGGTYLADIGLLPVRGVTG